MSHLSSKPPFPWRMALGFTALAALLRFAALGQEALFLDELLTINTSSIPTFPEFLRAFRHRDPHPPLYFLLMRYWTALFGDGHVALRFPSALFGALTVSVVMRALYESRCATRLSLIAVGFLAAVCPFHIYYSQEARPYAMQVLFFALNLLYAVRIWVDPRPLPHRSDLAALLLTAALAICTHYLSAFLLLLDFCMALLRQLSDQGRLFPLRFRAERFSPRIRVALACLILLALGATLPALFFHTGRELTGWLPRWEFPFIFYQWRAIAEGPLTVVCPDWLLYLSAGAWLAALAVAGWPSASSHGRPVAALAGFALFCTLVLPHLVSMFRPILFFGQRYTVIALPAFWLLTAAPLGWSRRPKIQAAFLLIFLAPAFIHLGSYYAFRQKRTWDTAAKLCMERLEKGDTVWRLTTEAESPLLYYLEPQASHKGIHVQLAADVSEFLPFPPASRRLAVVSIQPATLKMPAPPGFRLTARFSLETHRTDHEIYVLFFERAQANEAPAADLDEGRGAPGAQPQPKEFQNGAGD